MRQKWKLNREWIPPAKGSGRKGQKSSLLRDGFGYLFGFSEAGWVEGYLVAVACGVLDYPSFPYQFLSLLFDFASEVFGEAFGEIIEGRVDGAHITVPVKFF